jgi:hypothetical protein
MTSCCGALLLIVGVIALMQVFGLYPRALQAVRTSKRALEVMNDPTCGDDRKESLLQGYSLSLLRSFVDLFIRGVGSIAIAVALLWTLEFAGFVSLKAILALTRSWAFLLGGVIAAIAAFWFLEK